jgi:DNA-binding YbaB/EbfC family protein
MKGFDPNQLFAQAKKVREEMERAERDLQKRMVEGRSAQDLVTVIMNGMREIQAVMIRPDAVDPDDLELLEDLVLAAVKEATEKAQKLHDEAMGKATGGLPGLR